MKQLIKAFIIAFALAAILPACKKDAVDLENSYMDILLSSEGICWAADNEVRYVANLKPGTLSGEKVTVTYTSGADPEGFSVEVTYWNNELTVGRDVYNVQQLDYNFYAAAETNEEKKRLKVNPDGDKITITIGDNQFSETVDFVKKYNPLMVATITQGISGGLHGDINYYNETGERPTIKAYSDSDPTPVSLTPNNNLGDNGYYESNVEGSHDFGRTVYDISLIFDPEEALGYDYEVNANKESDILYVEIEGKTFSMPIAGENRFYKIIMTPAK